MAQRISFSMWIAQLVQISKHRLAYDITECDGPERFRAFFDSGETPDEAVTWFAEKYDLVDDSELWSSPPWKTTESGQA